MMDEKALEARRKYKREWARKNRDKMKVYEENFWKRRAQQMEAEQQPEAGSNEQ